jgi:uncharacterized protein
MPVVGKIESLWRYPVKSMRGEAIDEAFLGFAGVHGDRLYAFKSAGRPAGFPYLTAREQAAMLRFRPRFRHPARAALPPNLAEAQDIGPGLTPVAASPEDLALDVETPAGESLAIEDPRLIERLREGLGPEDRLTLLRSDRAMTDCRPISLFSIQTARQLGAEIGIDIDKCRFRANIYADLAAPGPAGRAGFGEDGFVGRRLRLGGRAVVAVLERDPRCAMIGLDPDTAMRNPAVLGKVAKAHGGTAGVYGAMLVEGLVRVGDAIELLDP